MRPTRLTYALRCFAVLAMAAASTACTDDFEPNQHPVILVTIDTLRADHVGPDAAGDSLTPVMDALSLESVSARQAFASIPRTTQSVGSILTGLHPLNHGADALDMVLPEQVETLAERFRAEGYATAAFVSNFILRPGKGFEQGFDIYSNPRTRWVGNSADDLVRESLEWVSDQQGKPFFLWLHLLDPHWPYEPALSSERAADLMARLEAAEFSEGDVIFHARELLNAEERESFRTFYAQEVAQTDRALGEFLRGLESSALASESFLLLTSDHGESLGEHDYWFAHGEYLYERTIRVPFLIRGPGVTSGRRLQGTILLEDVAPTLLDLAGMTANAESDGISLLPWLGENERSELPPRALLHLTDYHLVRKENPRRPVPGREGRWSALRLEPWKLIRIPGAGGMFIEELFRFDTDPDELNNLAVSEPEKLRRMRELLIREQQRWQQPQAGFTPEIDKESLDTLRSLGYLQ